MNRNHLLAPLLALLSSACSGSKSSSSTVADSSQSTTQQVAQSEDLSPGLRGIDADANGIRDDIDRLISAKFAQTPAVKKAAEQKARALQMMMEATTKEQAFAAGTQLGRAAACVDKALPGLEFYDLTVSISRQIESLTANTRERKAKYRNSNKLVGGGYFESPPEPVCD